LTLGLLKDLSDGNYLFSIPSAAINFAKSQGLVKTLANPRIRVLNRKKARFTIADRVPVAISTTTVAQTSTTGVTPEYKEVGIKMDFVLPFIRKITRSRWRLNWKSPPWEKRSRSRQKVNQQRHSHKEQEC